MPVPARFGLRSFRLWHRAVWLFAGLFAGPVVLAPPAAAQPGAFGETWRWVLFTTQTGLPSPRVFDVVETVDGTAWAVTQAGLAWFDGYQWHRVGTAQGLPAGRPDDWVAHPEGGLLVTKEGRMYRGDTAGFDALRLPSGRPVREAVPFSGGTFLGHSGAPGEAELFVFDPSDSTALRTLTAPFPLSSLGDQVLYRGGSGRFFVNMEGGLYTLRGDQWRPWIAGAQSTPMVAENRGGTGAAYVAFPPDVRGLWEWDAAAPPHRVLPADDLPIQAMDVSPAGDVLVVYASGDARLRHRGVWHDLEPNALPMRSVHSLRYRADGDLWVGADANLARFRATSHRWTHGRAPGPDRRNMINEVVVARDGSVWQATGRGVGVQRPDGTVRWFDTAAGTPLIDVTGLAEDAAGHIWVSSGSSFRGAFRWDGTRWHPAPAGSGLRDALVHKIRPDRRGDLWFVGFGPPGEAPVYRLAGGRVAAWPAAAALPSGRVYAFAEGADGAYWFGTTAGLSRWKDGQWTHLGTRNGRLRSARVFALTAGPDGRIWFAHQEPGTGVGAVGADDTNALHVTYSPPPAGGDLEVWDLRFDPAGRLWVASRNGAYLFTGGSWFGFDSSVGLSDARAWPILPLADRVFIGTTGGGLDVLHLNEAADPAPRITVSTSAVEETSVLVRWQTFSYLGKIPSTTIPTRYRLDRGPWSVWSTQHEVSLRNLAPGPHTLQIQGRGLFRTTTEPVVASFVVPRPLFQRPAFFVPVGLLATALFVAGLAGWRRRRRHDAALRQSETKYRTLFNQIADPVFLFDDHTLRILDCNEAALRAYGYPRMTMEQQTLADLYPFGDGDRLRQSLQARPDEHAGEPVFVTYLTGVGREVTVEMRFSRIDYRHRPAWLGIAYDVTERRQAQEEMRHAKEKAEEMVRLKDAFLANMSHEIRTPLTGILGFADLLAEEVGETQRDLLSIIETNGRRLLHTLTSVLDLARLESGSLPLEPGRFDLSRKIAETLTLFEPLARKKGLTLSHHPEKPLWVELDEAAFERILNNLINNAIKFTERGGVTVRASTAPRLLMLEVADTGVGIPPDFLPHLFHEFKQASSGLGRRHEGSGLGLAITRRVVEMMDGTITVASTPDQGTTFTIRIPLEVRSARVEGRSVKEEVRSAL